MSMFDVNRLVREAGWTADDLAQEVYAILDSAAVKGIAGPLRINTTGSNPAIIFSPQTLTQGTPFQLQTGGTSYNYSFGPQTGSQSGPVYYTGGSTSYGNTSYGGNSYTFSGGPGNSNTTIINFGTPGTTPGDFTPTPPGGGWGGGGGSGTGGGGNTISWPPLTDTLGDGGSGGVQVAVGQIAGGGGGKYQVDVKGFGGNSFTTDAVALGLSDEDTLDAGTWHVVVAYVTGPDTAEVYIVPSVFHSGTGKGG